MTHPLAAFFMTLFNSFFLGFIYYNAKYNFIKINTYTLAICFIIVLLARGSFVGIDYRTKKEKTIFYSLLLINLILLGCVGWEWYRD